jgi:hypothetical protein
MKDSDDGKLYILILNYISKSQSCHRRAPSQACQFKLEQDQTYIRNLKESILLLGFYTIITLGYTK